jgi:hypothetical protein
MRSWKFRQHYPEGMISAPVHCNKCNGETQHRIFNHRLSNVCIPCQEKAEAEHQRRLANPEPPAPVQEALFA